MRNRIGYLVTVALAAVSGLLTVTPPASAASGCAVEMQHRYSSGAVSHGEIRVMSVGRPLPDWTLRFQLQYVTEQIKHVGGRFAEQPWEQHGKQVTLHGLPGDVLPADFPVFIEYAMTRGAKLGNATAFTLNGITCATVLPPWASPSPTPNPTPSWTVSPSPGPDPDRPLVELTRPEVGDPFFAPATITVEATAKAAPGRQISRVEFFGRGEGSERVLLGTDTTAPYTAQWRALPAGGYVLDAWAYDNEGAVRNSLSVIVRVYEPSERRQAPNISVVRDKLWGISPIIEAAAPRRLAPLTRTGAESRCVHGQGIWDGPVDTNAVARLAGRGVKAVYIPLNEACWLGLPYVDRRYGGEPYQQEVTAYVHRLRAVGITPIVALAWSHGRYTGPGAICRDERAVCAKPMPHATYALDFWASVGSTLGSFGAVVFDLFSTPYPDRAIDDPALSWTCWRDGEQACSALGYPVIGMQKLLIETQRHIPGVMLASGLDGGNDLSQWETYRPFSGTYNAAAAWRPATPGDCRPPTLTQAPVVVTATCPPRNIRGSFRPR
ncbi:Ig-like domain-containing protein [Micromonospora endophytica]|uniref:Uncharacterized protein n=1 Tax=Micromonospora endophytica TaxID=515350 RepID=A0A2W2DEC6_9ACTN|nr:Ig-like domain-containing protein [Micromonospora endophytica]PZF95486.1 hypothetical protein C1I93_15230 [Micromonospora endophytica]RIW51413.1 hypothetical protein D3H59_00680 [Micromonospora endophytica]BCJ62125.1 hypothetical protein Jiend_55470 [Micromonospora endophytica]